MNQKSKLNNSDFHIEDVSEASDSDVPPPPKPQRPEPVIANRAHFNIANLQSDNWIESGVGHAKFNKKKPPKQDHGEFLTNYDRTFDDVFGEE